MKRFSDKHVNRAVELRRRGHSLSEISKSTGISKNTIYHWVKDISLSGSQKARILEKEIRCGKIGLHKAHKIKHIAIQTKRRDIAIRSKQHVKIVNKKSDYAKLLCGALYLCEGARYLAPKQMIFGNSDPGLIKLFLCLLRNNFAIDENRIRCRIMHRYDQDGDKLNRYWSRVTQIPLKHFYKHYRDKRTKGSRTKKPDYKGICAIQYNSADLQYEILAMGESLYSLAD